MPILTIAPLGIEQYHSFYFQPFQEHWPAVPAAKEFVCLNVLDHPRTYLVHSVVHDLVNGVILVNVCIKSEKELEPDLNKGSEQFNKMATKKRRVE